MLVYIHIVYKDKNISVKTKTVFSFALAVIVVLGLSELAIYLEAIVGRFTASTGDISSLTTNRSDLWAYYLNYMFDKIDVLIFGNSIVGRLGAMSTPHNMIIYCLFYLGIIGCAIFLSMMVSIYKSNKRFHGTIQKGSTVRLPLLFFLFYSMSIDCIFMHEVNMVILSICFSALYISDCDLRKY